jgi:3-carboxy-cis,cis-muconate cycloisomerase
MVSALDSAFTSRVYADEETAALFSDEAEIDALIKFERELALAQESLGIIPPGTGREISTDLDDFKVAPASLAQGYAKDGIPIPALLEILRQKLKAETATYLHFGATSQDALDTALIIRIRSATTIIKKNLNHLITELIDLANKHKSTVMIG